MFHNLIKNNAINLTPLLLYSQDTGLYRSNVTLYVDNVYSIRKLTVFGNFDLNFNRLANQPHTMSG